MTKCLSRREFLRLVALSAGATVGGRLLAACATPRWATKEIRGDGRSVRDGAMTAGSATLTSTTAAWTSSDVGKLVGVSGAGTAGQLLNTTIGAVVSATTVRLSKAASTTVRDATVTWGTDNSAALQASIKALSTAGGGTLQLPAGRYLLATPLVPASAVALVGEGSGLSILMPQGRAGAFFGTFSATAPLADVRFENLEIDGSCQSLDSGPYTSGIKGIYANYIVRGVFRNLYIHDTGATGLGVDYLAQSTIAQVTAVNCGRLNDGTQHGGAGIGIGTGGFPSADGLSREPLTIAHCTAIRNKRFGIFVERQSAVASIGTRIISCYAENNGIGIVDAGNAGLVVDGCVMVGNVGAGFSVSGGSVNVALGYDGMVSNCVIEQNGMHGIYYDGRILPANGTYTFHNNHIASNTLNGIRIEIGTNGGPTPNITISDNDIHDNTAIGVQVSNRPVLTDLVISGNRIYNNGQRTITGAQQGLRLDNSITRLKIAGNQIYDSQTIKKQTYGIEIGAGATISDGQIVDNDLRNNLLGAINQRGTLVATILRNNPGYNPQGPAAIIVGPSPFAYTAGPTPEVIYITGGMVSGITKAGATIATASPDTVTLAPNETIVVTYTAPPMMVRDQQ